MNKQAPLARTPLDKRVLAIAALLVQASANSAFAQDGVGVDVEYVADVIRPIAGVSHDRASFLDNLDISATFDMQRLAGWRGVTIFAHVLNNAGDLPNSDIGTAQGVDSIEVSRHRARLYEFWAEAPIGAGASVRAGLYDLNSEFYANESAGLLLSPAFGIGSELAATGPNGPSIFPSTALAVRVAMPLGEGQSLRFAALNANAGVLGDPGGVDFSFDRGALLIGQWSKDGAWRTGVGAWMYTDAQDDIRSLTGLGEPRRRRAVGAYVTLERDLSQWTTAFARVGVSDGDTTPYGGGWQAGVLLRNPLGVSDGSQASLGFYQGRFDDKERANIRDAGVRAAAAETGIELTYATPVTRWLSIQPDLQVVLDPAGDRDRADVWLAGLRFTITPFAADSGT